MAIAHRTVINIQAQEVDQAVHSHRYSQHLLSLPIIQENQFPAQEPVIVTINARPIRVHALDSALILPDQPIRQQDTQEEVLVVRRGQVMEVARQA